eukprot:1632919-Prymnesium_polylepis.1
MQRLPDEIVSIIAKPADIHPTSMISVLDIEEATGVKTVESYKIFGCTNRGELKEKTRSIESDLNDFIDAIIELCCTLDELNRAKQIVLPHVKDWVKEYYDAESTLRWLSGRMQGGYEETSILDGVFEGFEILFQTLPPWSNRVLKYELGITLPDRVDRLFGHEKEGELTRWLEGWAEPIQNALERMDQEGLKYGEKKLRKMINKLESYHEQIELHRPFINRFAQRAPAGPTFFCVCTSCCFTASWPEMALGIQYFRHAETVKVGVPKVPLNGTSSRVKSLTTEERASTRRGSRRASARRGLRLPLPAYDPILGWERWGRVPVSTFAGAGVEEVLLVARRGPWMRPVLRDGGRRGRIGRLP